MGVYTYFLGSDSPDNAVDHGRHYSAFKTAHYCRSSVVESGEIPIGHWRLDTEGVSPELRKEKIPGKHWSKYLADWKSLDRLITKLR